MFEDLDELEGEFFDLSNGECQETFMGYMTVCYGWEYDWDNNEDSYIMRMLYTEESEGKVGWSVMNQDDFYNCQDDIQKPDTKYYANPGQELIKRVFEFEWEN